MGVDASAVYGMGFEVANWRTLIPKCIELGIMSVTEEDEDDYDKWGMFDNITERFPTVTCQCPYGYEEYDNVYLFINASAYLDIIEKMPEYLKSVNFLGIPIKDGDVSLCGEAFFS